ncbi:protein REVEILLE 3-like [Oryza brachyantha]|uniref:protein REVEILLE 3-like n=1 Tax=Oryza brachyantha TaxID=4533 RepID=UPI001ADC77AB|nr:protein REVEILLE 3-like [Oryza brachyantha]
MAAMAAPVAGKKARKPYTITRPRERWSGEEHDRFLHALMLFGRDWKRIEGFVATKTAIQIRSHAQKHFLKARKFGLAGGLPPPLHPRRATPPACYAYSPEDSFRPLIQSNDDDCSFIETTNCIGSTESRSSDEAILLPVSPDDLGFAQVYKFVGDVFGSGEPRPVEAHLRRLHGMDPAISETILLVLRNLAANLCA